MTRTRHAVPAALALLATLAGCGSGDPTYYTLAPIPGAPRGGGPAVVEIGTPSVASFLDRDYIVTGTSDYALELAGNRAWAEPLGDMIGRVLAADLAERLPSSSVYAEGNAASANPVAIVDVDVGRFDKDHAGIVTVSGSLAIRTPTVSDGAPASGSFERFDLTASDAGDGTPALVATLSRLLGTVADRAADRLRALPVSGMPVPLAGRSTGAPG